MNCTRLFVSLGLSAGLLGSVAAQRGWLALPSLSWARGPQHQAVSLEAERQREAKLERQSKVTLGRISAKRSVTQQLLAGELTLLEAADCFRALNEVPSDCPGTAYLTLHPGNSEGERLCRQVISWVAGELLETDREEARATVERLEAELEAILATSGTVHLPGG
jgi:hypothetical protein